jgi:hypothetical protein
MKVCLRIGYDTAGDIEDLIDLKFQVSGERFSRFKTAIDALYEQFRIYNGDVPLSDTQKVKKLLKSVDPIFIPEQLLAFRKLPVLPRYAEVCRNFQSEEDAILWSEKNLLRRVSNPILSTACGSKLLLAGVDSTASRREERPPRHLR